MTFRRPWVVVSMTVVADQQPRKRSLSAMSGGQGFIESEERGVLFSVRGGCGDVDGAVAA